MYSANETSLFFNLQPSKTFSFQDFCNGDIKCKEWVTILLTYSADGSDKLLSLVTEKIVSPCCFRNVKRLLTKYETNTNSLAIKIFGECSTQLDRKQGARNCKILLFVDQHAAHSKNDRLFCNTEVVLFHLIVPASYSLKTWESSMHLGAITGSS